LCKKPDPEQDRDLFDQLDDNEIISWCAEEKYNLRLDKNIWPFFDALVPKICVQISSTSKRRDKQGKLRPLGTVYTISDEAFVR
jgi:hypothetical protein